MDFMTDDFTWTDELLETPDLGLALEGETACGGKALGDPEGDDPLPDLEAMTPVAGSAPSLEPAEPEGALLAGVDFSREISPSGVPPLPPPPHEGDAPLLATFPEGGLVVPNEIPGLATFESESFLSLRAKRPASDDDDGAAAAATAGKRPARSAPTGPKFGAVPATTTMPPSRVPTMPSITGTKEESLARKMVETATYGGAVGPLWDAATQHNCAAGKRMSDLVALVHHFVGMCKRQDIKDPHVRGSVVKRLGEILRFGETMVAGGVMLEQQNKLFVAAVQRCMDNMRTNHDVVIGKWGEAQEAFTSTVGKTAEQIDVTVKQLIEICEKHASEKKRLAKTKKGASSSMLLAHRARMVGKLLEEVHAKLDALRNTESFFRDAVSVLTARLEQKDGELEEKDKEIARLREELQAANAQRTRDNFVSM